MRISNGVLKGEVLRILVDRRRYCISNGVLKDAVAKIMMRFALNFCASPMEY